MSDRDHLRFGPDPLALDDVTWSVPVGARACLLGPNGAGKSTAIRLLESALTPTTGHVSLLGVDVNRGDYLRARRRTGIVPQGPGMYTDISVAEYLELARRLYGGGDVARLEEVLELGPHRDKMLSQLSGGYQRLYFEHVLQADTGADLDFLVGCRGAVVARESH